MTSQNKIYVFGNSNFQKTNFHLSRTNFEKFIFQRIGHLRNATGSAHDRLRIYDPRTDTWTETSVIPLPQSRPTLCVSDGFIYLIGSLSFLLYARNFIFRRVGNSQICLGGLDDVQNIATARVQCYDVEGDRWINVPPLMNCRYACGKFFDFETNIEDSLNRAIKPLSGAAALNGKIYAFGGMDQSDEPRNIFNLDELTHRNPVLDSVECYDPATEKWIAAGTLPKPTAKMSSVTMSVSVWMSSFKL